MSDLPGDGGVDVTPEPFNEADNGTTSIGTSATSLLGSSERTETVIITNVGTQDVYVGFSGVTTANGMPLTKRGGSITLTLDNSLAEIFLISSGGTQDVRWLWMRHEQ